MPTLPSGTVTFLFSDIEGSTRLLQELGERRYAEALAEHRRIMRQAFALSNGTEVDTQGDAFFAAFATAPDAIDAAKQATRLLATGPIRVRIGLHTGTPLVDAEGYVGADVHRAARIGAAGHGGQVLVSETTALLVERQGMRDLGAHRLKDLAAAERIYQLGEGEFPPLKSLYRTNLPVPATSFVGRDRELADVVELITRRNLRLCTLIGPGGSGKTRLALQAAAEAAEGFPDGIWWVPLAPLRDPAHILSSVAGTFGLKEQPDKTLEESLSSGLSGRHALLLLDNCEHLLPEIAAAISFLRDLDGPLLFATSRERLRVGGEQAWPVPPLTEGDAVALFGARARRVDPSFVASPAVAELCARLDQLPLAVELAAARTSLFTPEQLFERLGQRLDLLSGDRDVDPRQRTLRAMIDWSYELLTPEEKDLFCKMSVFAGGCTYEAAESVCDGDPDRLQSLLDKSLLRRRDEVTPRYWMLETLREFASERLTASGGEDETRSAHMSWFAARGAELAMAVRYDEADARSILESDLGNMRAALAHALSRLDVRVAGDCLYGLWFYWLTQGLGHEAKSAAECWLALDRTGLTRSGQLPGLIASSAILRWTGDERAAAEINYQVLSIARSIKGGSVHGWDIDRIVPAILSDVAQLELTLGHPEQARVLADEALSIRREIGLPKGIGHALVAVGKVALVEGDIQRARACFAEAAEALSRTNDAPEPVLLLAESELLLGDFPAAAHELQAAVAELRRIHDVLGVANAGRVGAMLALESGDWATAATLSGAFVRTLEEAGIPISGDAFVERAHAKTVTRLRAMLGEEPFNIAYMRGRQLTRSDVLDQAKSVASSVLPVDPVTPSRSSDSARAADSRDERR
jgi:predicted ATPase/class 3 adenylate cyclase